MPYRINGTGTTISPMPARGQYSIAMHWITILFIPLIPLGWQLVKGYGIEEYQIIRKLTYLEVKKAIGIKGMLLTIGYAFFTNILMLVWVCIMLLIFRWLKS